MPSNQEINIVLLIEKDKITVIITPNQELTKSFYEILKEEERSHVGSRRSDHDDFYSVTFPLADINVERLQKPFTAAEYMVQRSMVLKCYLYSLAILLTLLASYLIVENVPLKAFVLFLFMSLLVYKLNKMYRLYTDKLLALAQIKTYVMFMYATTINNDLIETHRAAATMQAAIGNVNREADKVMATSRETTERYNDLRKRVSPSVLKSHTEYCNQRYGKLTLAEADNPTIIH